MSRKVNRHHSEAVTITYPPGCREISEDLGNDELIRRFKSLAHTFQGFAQAEEDSKYAEYVPLSLHLADEAYLKHHSRDVQLLAACCIADILRIYAPEAPYKDPAQIKAIFYFLIKQLGGLRDPKDPAFKRYFYLLENLAYVKSFGMCFDLEDCNEVFCALFSLFFKILNDEHSGKVKAFMLDVLCPLITEADFVSFELLDIILINIVEPCKSQRKNAFSLASDLISKCVTFLAPYIQQFFNQVLILGKTYSELSITKKVYDLIYELNNIAPSILLGVLPQLDFKLKSTEESERMGAVSLLAKMFSEKDSKLALNHKQLWLAFLGRYNDISVAIRTKCVQYTMHFLLNHPELQSGIVETLKARQHDSDENVRKEVVMAIVSTAKKDFDIVSKSEDLLNCVKERTLDKKFKIRREAMTGLAMIYKKHISCPQASPEATENAVQWIRNKILHGYYMAEIEDRLLVERLLNLCLVPFNLESAERMKKLFLLFTSIDEYASKAFIEMQKHQMLVRKAVAELLPLYRQAKSERRDREIQVKVHGISKLLSEPMKAQEFLKKLSNHFLSDTNLLGLFEKLVAPDVSCSDCQGFVHEILKKTGSPIATNLYYGTVKQLLERVSSVMIDRKAIQHLVGFVKEALDHGPILTELGLEPAAAAERGLRLLFVLSYVFPSHFQYQDIIKQMMGLGIEGENVGPPVLSALTHVGRNKPIETAFPDLMKHLVPICETFVRGGTPKQAKQAIKFLNRNTTESKDTVFASLLDIVKTNLNGPRTEAYLTAVVSLGHIAFFMPDKYPVHIKNLVARNIVKQLIMQEGSEEADDAESEWLDFSNLPLDTRCKVEALKLLARWLIGLKDDSLSAKKTFRMLNAIIASKGDLHEHGKLSPSERAWMRLGAGCAFLKICEQKGVGDEYTQSQFVNLSMLAMDEVKQVREMFVSKLHKGLMKGLPRKCLPLDFMGIYGLCGLETDKACLQAFKRFVLTDVVKRMDCIKSISLSGGMDNEQLPSIMPEYMLSHAIAVLTHHPSYKDNADRQFLVEKMRPALLFILEPLLAQKDSFSYAFYKALIEKMKRHVVVSETPSDVLNKKMWALCDLAFLLIIGKSSNFDMRELAAEPTIPVVFFKPHEDENFYNVEVYIPTDLEKDFKAKRLVFAAGPPRKETNNKAGPGEVATATATTGDTSDRPESGGDNSKNNGSAEEEPQSKLSETKATRKRTQQQKNGDDTEAAEGQGTTSTTTTTSKQLHQQDVEDGGDEDSNRRPKRTRTAR